MTGGNESQLFASMFASHDKTKFAPSDAHMRVALALRALELAPRPLPRRSGHGSLRRVRRESWQTSLHPLLNHYESDN